MLDIQKIAKNSALLYVRLLFTIIIGLYTSRVILRTLGVIDFGVYNVVGGVVTFFTVFSGPLLNSTRSALSYEIGANNELRLKKVLSTSFYINLVSAVLVLLLTVMIGSWVVQNVLQIPLLRKDAALYVLYISAAIAFFNILRIPFEADVISHEKFSFFALVSIIENFAQLIVVFLLVLMDGDKLIIYVLLMMAVSVMSCMAYYVYCRLKFNEAKTLSSYDTGVFKQLFSLIGWSMFGGAAGICKNQGINILLNVFYGPTVNAARGITVQVQAVLFRFCNNIQQAINPQITKTYAANDLEGMHKLIIISSKAPYLLLFTLSLPVFGGTDFILALWLGEFPPHTIDFIRIILIINLLNILVSPLAIATLATGKLKVYQLVVETITLMALPFSYFYLKYVSDAWPGVVYVILLVVSVISHFARVMIVLPNIKMKKISYFQYVVAPLLSFSVFMVVVCAIYMAYFELNSILSIIVFSLFSFLFAIITAFYLALDKEEQKLVVNMIRKSKNER